MNYENEISSLRARPIQSGLTSSSSNRTIMCWGFVCNLLALLCFVNLLLATVVNSWTTTPLMSITAFRRKSRSIRTLPYQTCRHSQSTSCIPRGACLRASKYPKEQEGGNDQDLDEALKYMSEVSKVANSKYQDPSIGYSVPDLESIVSKKSGSVSPPSKSPIRSKSNFDQEGNFGDEIEDRNDMVDPLASFADGAMPYGESVPLEQTETNEEDVADGTATRGIESTNNEPDGIFLGPDAYINSRSYMNPDGSLRFSNDKDNSRASKGRSEILERILIPPDLSPDIGVRGYESPKKKQQQPSAATIEDLVSAMEKVQSRDKAQLAKRAEELHQKVFESEQVYLQQSELFRRSLTNRTAAMQAMEVRRSANYRRKQATNIEKLDRQMKEVEGILQQLSSRQESAKKKLLGRRQDRGGGIKSVGGTSSNKVNVGGRICEKCSCQLKLDELEYEAGPYSLICAACYKSVTAKGLLSQDFDVDDDDDDLGTEKNIQKMLSLDDDIVEDDDQGGDLNNEEEENDGWVKLDDLSTGEHFYWNERTGEMRREI